MNVDVPKLLKFAQDNGFKFSPYDDVHSRVEKMNEKGHCLCDKNRLECPCFQAEIEVKTIGRCKCTMFVSEEYYCWMMKRKIEHDKTGKWASDMFVMHG